jgi:Ca2+-binding EF-hand superfamily protein
MRIRHVVVFVLLGFLSLLIGVQLSHTQSPAVFPDDGERGPQSLVPPSDHDRSAQSRLPPSDRERGARGPLPSGLLGNPIPVITSSPDERFNELDRDHNGLLSFDEMPDALKAETDRWDINKDGFIDLAEWKTFLEAFLAQRRLPTNPASGPSGPGRPTRIPGAALPLNEVRGPMSSVRPPFKDPQRPTDRPPSKHPKNIPAWFKDYDQDDDGQVSRHEWKIKGDNLEEFKRYDLNDDGLITIGELIRSGQFITNTKAPPMGQGLQGEAGDYFYFEVTGSGRGPLWGTDVYTSDSSIAAAAVHAGVLEVGEKRLIKVTVLPGQQTYEGTERNGITSQAFGTFPRSFSVGPVRLFP